MDGTADLMMNHVKTALARPGSHGLDHVRRVVGLCEIIGNAENADMKILLPAAIFHDIARPEEAKKGIPHEEAGARMAEKFLRSIRYDEERIPKIVHAIRSHRYRTTVKPETLEARILSDADKLDAMGAVGIARTFIRAGEHGGDIADAVDHINDKLLKLDAVMYTGTGKAIAQERHRFLCTFLETLRRDMNRPDIDI